ncbi:hypothetical protein AeMF1_019842 [Aphanomyces euteiches]|nr:hypothetical protein AeMF1_019842 [Aphanomyces euteiches]KAH9185844.1 hypothetical protein AeNC1_012179 [Aphanomyces euteiches]
MSHLHNDSHCKYIYKVCLNPRTLKKDGSLHRLCEFHRAKANTLQKVYATKRRRERRAERKMLLEAKKCAAAAAATALVKTEPIKCEGEPGEFVLDTLADFFFDDKWAFDLIEFEADGHNMLDDDVFVTVA